MSRPQQEKVPVGQLAGPGATRDAIHVAVLPVVAAEAMDPGRKCGLYADGSAGKYPARVLGVVDPFLDAAVKPGETFYLFLIPGTVTSLRHAWTHPHVPAEAVLPAAAPAEGAGRG
jgi:hypothetical protein